MYNSTRVFALLFSAFAFAVLGSCSNEISQPNDFAEYIAAYTYGIVPADQEIVVEFMQDITNEVPIGVPLSSDLMRVENLEGTLILEHESRLVFRPEQLPEQGATYHVELNLNELFKDVPSNLHVFAFEFEIMKQQISASNPYYKVDLNNADEVSVFFNIDMVSASYGLDTAKLISNSTFEHDSLSIRSLGKRVLRVGLHGIQKPDTKSTMSFTVNGAALSSSEQLPLSITLPGIHDFYVASVRTQKSPQAVIIEFSDAIDPELDITGLIEVENTSVTTEVEGNTIQLFPQTSVVGKRLVTVHQGMKSVRGNTLDAMHQATVQFDSYKPQVEYADSKVIYPASERVTVPIRAVSLTAVDVLVIETRPHRMGQRLLMNSRMQHTSYVRQLAKPILYKKVVLGEKNDESLSSWQTYELDLSDIPGYEPGALYTIVLGFRPSYAVYACQDEDELTDDMIEIPDFKNGEYSWMSYSGATSRTNNWKDRNNPCTPSYYTSRKWVSKNILISDIGLISKKGSKKQQLYAMSLSTAESLENVGIVVLDQQLDTIVRGTTNKNGLFEWEKPNDVFAAIARYKNSVSYIHFNSSYTLSHSNFDVSGVSNSKGVRAFVYGERGVWRPGDTLFLTGIIEDGLETLPENHPAVMRVYDPQRTEMGVYEPRKQLNQVYSFAIPTREQDKTGLWTVEFELGNNTFTKYVRVETVKPNRLSVDLSFAQDTLLLRSNSLRADLHAEWLHGGRLGETEAEYECRIVPQYMRFKQLPGYEFTNRSTGATGFKKAWQGKLNYNGDAVVVPDLDDETIESFSRVDFRGKVYEPSGAFSVDYNSVYVSPYESYVGFKLPESDTYYYYLDTTYAIPIRTVDISGKPSKTNKVRAKVYKVNWRWWWNSSGGSSREYIRRQNLSPIVEEEVEIHHGKGMWNVHMPSTGYGRYYIEIEDLSSGHVSSTHMYLDWPWWYDVRDRKDVTGGESMLTLSLDKERYAPGDKAVVRFPASEGARALVTLESGTAVLHQEWMDCAQGANELSIPVKGEYAPNVYVHVMLLQPFKKTNDHPIRTYGVVPLFVDNPASKLSPVIVCKDEVRPESAMQVQVKESAGKAMTYTLAVVDEGLLDLTNYKTPNPWSFFYQRRALGVTTWDIYDDVAHANGDVISRIVALGGGGADEAEGESSSRGKRFKPMVRFIGPFHLKKGETATHTIEVPRYIGKVRVMVVAREKTSYGSSDAEVRVKSPIMVASTFPRLLSPGDTIDVPVTVFHMRESNENVRLNLSINGPLRLLDPSQKTIAFSGESDSVVTYTCAVKEQTGPVKCIVTASAGSERATEETDLEVRVPERSRTVVQAGVAEPSWSTEFTPYGLVGTRSAFVELSTVPELNLMERLDQLTRYPYGCIEQTISKVLPQLVVGDLVDLPVEVKEKITFNVSAAQERLLLFQTSDGGMSYWPGGSPSQFGAVYAMHFLAESKKRSYAINSNLLNKLVAYNTKVSNEWYNGANAGDTYLQAYRLYVLAYHGRAQIGAMNRLRSKDIRGSARWWLAGAYVHAGKTSVAKEIVNSLVVSDDDYVYVPRAYGSRYRYSSIIGMVQAQLGMLSPAKQTLKPVVEAVANTNMYMSTQSAAFSLMALSSVYGGADNHITAEVEYNGEVHSVNTAKTIVQIPIDPDTASPISVTSRGKRVFVRVVQIGTPMQAIQSDVAKGLAFSVRYHDDEGKEIDVSKLTQGTEFWAEFKIKDSYERNMRNMALDFRLPCGWEIVDDSGSDLASASSYQYRDIRDDRVYLFFSLRRDYERTYRVRLHASFVGSYYVPSVFAGEMYDGDTESYLGSSRVYVVAE